MIIFLKLRTCLELDDEHFNVFKKKIKAMIFFTWEDESLTFVAMISDYTKLVLLHLVLLEWEENCGVKLHVGC